MSNTESPQWVGRNLGPAVPGKHPTWELDFGWVKLVIEKRTTDLHPDGWWDISVHGAQALGMPKRFPCLPGAVTPPDEVFEAALELRVTEFTESRMRL